MPVLDMYFNFKELGGEHMTIALAVIAVVGVLVMHGVDLRIFEFSIKLLTMTALVGYGWELSFKSLSDRETWTDTIRKKRSKRYATTKR